MTLRTLDEIIRYLSLPIEPKFLQTKTKGGTKLTFISWHGAVQLLDEYAPGWSSEVTYLTQNDKYVILKVSITIVHAANEDGGVATTTREATGLEEWECSSYGDPSSNAESMAFRRAASKFGLALYLYDKEKREAMLPSTWENSVKNQTAPVRKTYAKPY